MVPFGTHLFYVLVTFDFLSSFSDSVSVLMRSDTKLAYRFSLKTMPSPAGRLIDARL